MNWIQFNLEAEEERGGEITVNCKPEIEREREREREKAP